MLFHLKQKRDVVPLEIEEEPDKEVIEKVIKLLKEGKADEKIQEDFQAKNLEDTFKMLFADLEYLKKNEKEISSLDKEQVQSMFNDVKQCILLPQTLFRELQS